MNRVAAAVVLTLVLASPLWAAFGVSNVVSGEIVREKTPQISEKPAPPPDKQPETRAACAKTVYYPYTIHLSSWQDIVIARKEAQKVALTLQPVFITTIDLGERGVWHRVDYGLFPSAKDAFARLDDIKKLKIIEKGSFVGGKVPFTIEVGQAASAEEVAGLEKVFADRGFFVYVIQEEPDCYRVVSGAYPSPASANQAYRSLQDAGIEGRISRR